MKRLILSLSTLLALPATFLLAEPSTEVRHVSSAHSATETTGRIGVVNAKKMFGAIQSRETRTI